MKQGLSAVLLCLALAACATSQRQQAGSSATSQIALPPAPPPGEPADVAGIAAAQLRVAFGTPALVRKDGLSEMWRYDGSSCKAFFFLYASNGALAVRHVETVPRGREIAADSACLDSLRVRAGATPVS